MKVTVCLAIGGKGSSKVNDDTKVNLTVEGLQKLKRDLDKLNVGPRETLKCGLFDGMKMFESNYLPTTTEEYEVEVELTFRERWIEPLLHPAILNFEPWIKVRTEIRYKEVPNKNYYILNNALFASPFAMHVIRKLGIINNTSC